jgi:hypothetical protein
MHRAEINRIIVGEVPEVEVHPKDRSWFDKLFGLNKFQKPRIFTLERHPYRWAYYSMQVEILGDTGYVTEYDMEVAEC